MTLEDRVFLKLNMLKGLTGSKSFLEWELPLAGMSLY